jgi:hypothetical protein
MQIDINPYSEEGWKFCEESLISLCKNGGAKLIRLDAFGYVTKKAGTDCFMEVSSDLKTSRLVSVEHCYCNSDDKMHTKHGMRTVVSGVGHETPRAHGCRSHQCTTDGTGQLKITL